MSPSPMALEELARLFAERFGGTEPTHLVRAPGRVNLIGDHVDYLGLGVLPIAIERESVIALSVRDDADVILTNADPAFPDRQFVLEPGVPPGAAGDWGNYAKAAAVDVAVRGGGRGMNALVASDIPIASGLSSSSSLTIAVELALLTANAIEPDRHQLMEDVARAERYVGTQGGGMDQAVSLGGRIGEAVRIDFWPLRLSYVPVPPSWRFIVASSLATAEKSGAVRDAYNGLADECRAALEVFRRAVSLPEGVASYPDLVRWGGPSLLLAEAERCLDPPLRSRFRHVVTENDRVWAAVEALGERDPGRFGRLMLKSHESLGRDFGVSTADLDRLVDLAVESGAYGARLTGAGRGGCIVALVAAGRVADVLERIWTGFYAPRGLTERGDVLFAVTPSAGASVHELRTEA